MAFFESLLKYKGTPLWKRGMGSKNGVFQQSQTEQNLAHS